VDLSDWEGVLHPAGRGDKATGTGADGNRPGRSGVRSARYRDLRPMLGAVILLATLSACGSAPVHHAAPPPATAAQTREYAPPGPPEDPWGPYIREAAQRYELPEPYIRAVMRQESGGQEFRNGSVITSPAGAIGLMQVMPETYAALRDRYGLGPDPYYPKDNILAGTAYLRELYDRFGSPGFLAAYNAGPQRLSDHLVTGKPLPAETVAYVAAIGPRIGAGSTVPAGAHQNYAVASSSAASDSLNRQALAAAATGRGGAPLSVPPTLAPTPMPVSAPPPKYASAAPVPAPIMVAALATSGGNWGIQVGAFSTQATAQAAADNVRAHAHGQLDTARTVVPVTTRPDGAILYRARLLGISADAASTVCNNLARDQVSCIVVTEDHV
jgi:D-alanyl-D-alanine carboxypeptidase